MSQPDLTSPAAPPGRSVVVQRPKNDVYTVLLGIALLAIVIACILLWLEFRRYKGDINATSAKSVAAVQAERPALCGSRLS
ncbi:MAG TPA: hypothetical protein VJ783_14695 [Pirellulales bacterium]|nr:hypothetical protein [Pirellulales bacterium]